MASPKSFTKTQIILHWLIVGLVAVQIFDHGPIEALWSARMSGAVPNVPSPDLHAAVGILILLLMLWRVWLRVRVGAPAPSANEPRPARLLAAGVQGLLYLCLLLLPLSGAAAWFFGLGPAASAHVLIKNLLLLLLLLHVAGAFAQHFVLKSDALMRMFGRA